MKITHSKFNRYDVYFLVVTIVYVLWRVVIFLKRYP